MFYIKPPTEKYTGGIHGSNCLCSRGWPYLALMEGESLDPVETQCPNQCRGMLGWWVDGWGS